MKINSESLEITLGSLSDEEPSNSTHHVPLLQTGPVHVADIHGQYK